MRFRGEWRDYQAQVLEEMAASLGNGRLHVAAAPGAGKTVLGLEIVRRIGRRALVFAPTTTIRDQWAQRLVPLFLETPPPETELSRDLAVLRDLTLTTYQALDVLRRADDLDALAGRLNAAGPLTLVLDEAHHLRREWWNGLERLTAALDDARIVALTATPPYDAAPVEWSRYERLCGPIDLEIGIPELVRNGDLCPHQDYVILSRPTADTLKLLDDRRRAIAELQRDLRADAELLNTLEEHPWLRRPTRNVEAILDAPEMLSAILIFLKAAGRRPPAAALRLLGVAGRHLPPPSFFWLEIFLEGVTGRHAETFPLGPRRRKELRDRLHRHGLIEGRRVRLRHNRSIFRQMASSLSKLDSIEEVVRSEDRSLGAALRMVVLSDHVRAAELPEQPDAPFRPAKLGVVPIFEQLRRAGVADGRVGVLTGALVIVPRSALPALERSARAEFRAMDLPGCPDHLRIEPANSGARLVQCVTELLLQGEIRILVGTQSLLGEGWDAPALNSLILASNTASYVLSNQMRGRAIRIDASDPGKVANIWHLATVEPEAVNPLTAAIEALNWGDLDDDADGGSEIALLSRRFRAFEGVSNGDSTLIESGIGRLGLDFARDVQTTNRTTLGAAADRPATATRWSESLGSGSPRSRVRETAAPTTAPRVFAWSDTLGALGWGAASAALLAVGEELFWADPGAGISLMGLGAALAFASAPKLLRAGRLIWRNGSVEGCLAQVGSVILESLRHAGLVSEEDARAGRFEIRTSVDGGKDVVLLGASRGAERQVMQAIAEVLGPVENARYLLVRSSWLGPRSRTDYHAVPSALGAKKEWAEHFAALWKARIGSASLVFTRTPAGRRILLRARVKSFAAGFQRAVDRRSAWL